MSENIIKISKSTIIGKQCREKFLPSAANHCFAETGIVMGGISKLKGEYCIYRSSPDFHLLLYTISGKGRLSCDGLREDLTEGDLLTLPMGIPHNYCIADAEWHILWLHLAKDALSPQAEIRKSLLTTESAP